jgi:hypothetical protein
MNGTYLLMALSSVMPTSAHEDALSVLNALRKTLEQSSDRWSHILIVSTGIVAAGVVLEIVAEAMEVRKDLKEGKKIEPFHIIAFVAASIVALFVAVEGYAEFKVADKETALRKNNSETQLELQASANDANQTANNATAQAVALAEKEGGLAKLVQEKSDEIDRLRSNLQAATDRANRALGQVSGLEKEELSFKAEIANQERSLNALSTKTKELESTADGLLSDLLPRAIDQFRLKARLANAQKGLIFITSVPNREPREFASYLSLALGVSGYKVTNLHASGIKIFDGVLIQFFFDENDRTGRWPDELWQHAREIATALMAEGVEARADFIQDGWEPCVPKDALLIRVLDKPSNFFAQKQIEQERAKNPNGNVVINGRMGFRISDDEACTPTKQ